MAVKLYCVGCGQYLFDVDGQMLCYTHSCGATLFRTEDGILTPPASLIRAVVEKRDMPHIDYYLGTSDYTDELKTRLIEELKTFGAIWSTDCDECRRKATRRALALKEWKKEVRNPNEMQG